MTRPNPTDPPRWNLIRHLREQIARGTYETPGKLRVVADRIREEVSPAPDLLHRLLDEQRRDGPQDR